jgi:WD40 repeat protein
MFFFGPETGKTLQEVREIAQPPLNNHRAPSPTTNLPASKEIASNGTNDTPSQTAPKRGRKTTTAGVTNGGGARKQAPTSAGLVTNIELNVPNGHPPSVSDARSPSAPEPGPEEAVLNANGVHHEDRMDVDTDGDPQDELVEQAPVLPTLTNGESRAVQVEPAKIANLGPSTSILGSGDNMPLSEIVWHPDNHAILTGRTDTSCGVWKTSTLHQGMTPAMQDLLRYPANGDTFVTAVAWEPRGKMLAVAASTGSGGQIHLYDGDDLGLIESLTASQRMIYRLKWQKNGSRLVGLAPLDDETGESQSSIVLWDLSPGSSHQSPLCVPTFEQLEDIDCAIFEEQAVVVASGGTTVYLCRAQPDLEVQNKWRSPSTEHADNWSFVRCAWNTLGETLVVAASSTTGRIWLPDINRIHDAHQAPITGLQVRPNPGGGFGALSTTEFATCSMDGTIKAWKLMKDKAPTLLNVMNLDHSQPFKALSYSPDGFCLAGASYADIRIWNAEHGYHQMATWQGSEPAWNARALTEEDNVSNGGVSSINGDTSAAADHSLAWDAHSMKLAYALGPQVRVFPSCLLSAGANIQQIALIDFQR